MYVVTSSNKAQWLDDFASWQESDEFPEKFAHAMVSSNLLELTGGSEVTLIITNALDNKSVKSIKLTTLHPGAMLGAVAGELIRVFGLVGLDLMDSKLQREFRMANTDGAALEMMLISLDLMDSEFQTEFHWPPNADGVVLELKRT